MSKIVYLCLRQAELSPYSREELEHISSRINPDNISPKKSVLYDSGGILYSIINPTGTISIEDQSVLLGMPFGASEGWNIVGAPVPDGSFAIFRSNDKELELATDVVGSRTVWYFINEDCLIASTSQRAIIMLLKDFQFNQDVVPWMLSTGSLGPDNSWDRRVKMIPPDSILRLDRQTWELSIESEPVIFSDEKLDESGHYEKLYTSLQETFRMISLDFKRWVLPLSGGVDSRSILCFFKSLGHDITALKTITLGQKKSLEIEGNDSVIAQQVAEVFKIENKFYPMDLEGGSLTEILDRFLSCGEGRIDHISGYMDGLKLWKTLYEEGVEGVIRGDESFGLMPLETLRQVRVRIGMGLCSDFANLQSYKKSDTSDQCIPAYLQPRSDECPEKWRDRLYQQYRIPVIMAALNDLKLSYVEIINPLLSRRVIYNTRSLPDALRRNKLLFKRIAKKMSPPIRYADSGANLDKKKLLRTPAFLAVLNRELASETAKDILDERFLESIVKALTSGKNGPSNRSKSLKVFLEKYLPKSIKRYLIRASPKPMVDYHVIAFRVLMITRSIRLLNMDANLVNKENISCN